MKKKIVLILALIGATFAILGAGAPAASAANCTPTINQTYWSGTNNQLQFDPILYNCTGVNGVEFKRKISPGIGWPDGTGWHDISDGFWYNAAGPPESQQFFYVASSYSWSWGRYPVCPPGFTHTVSERFVWRIRNSVGNTWGSWKTTWFPYHNILC